MSCDIIIVVWNQAKITRRCLESIVNMTEADYHLILIDNASNDETSKYLEDFTDTGGDKVVLLKNKTNLGFLKAANQGLMKSTAKYVCLLNNDTVVTKGWLRELMSIAESNPQLGILNPSSTTLGQKVPLKDIGKYAGKVKRYQSEYIEMAQASGFCMFIKREVIDRIGLLDERYGTGYFEDTDYSRRAKEAGFKIARVKAAYVYHQENASFIKFKGRDETFRANREIFEERWGRPKRVFVESKEGLNKREIELFLNVANKANWVIIARNNHAAVELRHSNIKFLSYPAWMFYALVFFKILKRVKKKYDILIIRSRRLKNMLEFFKFTHKAKVVTFRQACLPEAGLTISRQAEEVLK